MGVINLDSLKIKTQARQIGHGTYSTVYYTFHVDFSLWGDNKEASNVLNQIRSGAFIGFLQTLATEKIKVEAEQHYKAEFILSQLVHVMQLIDQKKTSEAVILFKLVEEIMPEYQDNPRTNEINETRNVVWDMLARRNLI